jgi:hypothetical protein
VRVVGQIERFAEVRAEDRQQVEDRYAELAGDLRDEPLRRIADQHPLVRVVAGAAQEFEVRPAHLHRVREHDEQEPCAERTRLGGDLAHHLAQPARPGAALVGLDQQVRREVVLALLARHEQQPGIHLAGARTRDEVGVLAAREHRVEVEVRPSLPLRHHVVEARAVHPGTQGIAQTPEHARQRLWRLVADHVDQVVSGVIEVHDDIRRQRPALLAQDDQIVRGAVARLREVRELEGGVAERVEELVVERPATLVDEGVSEQQEAPLGARMPALDA